MTCFRCRLLTVLSSVNSSPLSLFSLLFFSLTSRPEFCLSKELTIYMFSPNFHLYHVTPPTQGRFFCFSPLSPPPLFHVPACSDPPVSLFPPLWKHLFTHRLNRKTRPSHYPSTRFFLFCRPGSSPAHPPARWVRCSPNSATQFRSIPSRPPLFLSAVHFSSSSLSVPPHIPPTVPKM